MKEKGFTLIEMLVAVSIVAILSTLSTEVVLSLVRSSNKTAVTNEAKQNGQTILDTFEKDVRSAKLVSLVSSTDLHLTMLNDSTVDYVCGSGGVRNDYISRGGQIITNDDPDNGVNVQAGSCVFTVSSSSPPLVKFNFTLTEPKNKALIASGRQEFKITVPFETTISLRNY